MNEKLRGVNLGGWLVLEKWMTPSLFAGTNAVDEYTFMQTANGKKRIEKQRQTFITEKDFVWLKQHGVTLVRIPVGYWLFEPVDGFVPSVKYLDLAMKWGKKHGIQVLLCLHAARGSQNGFEHSGKAGAAEWFERADYRAETMQLLARIASTYRDHPALWGVELLNEPGPAMQHGRHKVLKKFHRDAYATLSDTLHDQTHIVFHDAFEPWRTFNTFRRRARAVVMDVHWYAYPLPTNNFAGYLRWSRLLRRMALWLLQLWHPVIVGEWSSVLPQKFFDQVPESTHMDLLKRNVAMQQGEYRRAAGWIYWSYKHEQGGMWDFRDLVEKGVLDPTK